MASDAESILELLLFHCSLFRYGHSGSPEHMFNPIARAYNQFSGLHLITTMFLVDARGGSFRRALLPMGLQHLVDPVCDVLDTPVGGTTFGDFIRKSRNKLCTHGDLSFESLPASVQQVSLNSALAEQCEHLMDELAERVFSLERALKEELEKVKAS